MINNNQNIKEENGVNAPSLQSKTIKNLKLLKREAESYIFERGVLR